MGQVHVRVLLTNYREAVLARLGEHILLGMTVLEELDSVSLRYTALKTDD